MITSYDRPQKWHKWSKKSPARPTPHISHPGGRWPNGPRLRVENNAANYHHRWKIRKSMEFQWKSMEIEWDQTNSGDVQEFLQEIVESFAESASFLTSERILTISVGVKQNVSNTDLEQNYLEQNVQKKSIKGFDSSVLSLLNVLQFVWGNDNRRSVKICQVVNV